MEADVHFREAEGGAPTEPGHTAVDGVRPRRISLARRALSVALPAAVCVAGIGFAAMMVATAPEAERTAQEEQGVPVEATIATMTSTPLVVRAQGQVGAARTLRVQSEVAGRIVWMHPDLVPGGRISSGDRLVRVDPRDYQTALERQRATLENSRLQLAQENSRRVIAEREWALLGDRTRSSTDGRDLALRAPQQVSAQASLRAAERSVQQAQTNLRRTTLVAPFDAMVQTESAEIGQLVTQASPLATLIGTEHFWVQISVPMEQLAWIRLPDGDRPGASATVRQTVGESGQIERRGRVVRLLGDLDPVGRMARLLVEIDDPLGLEGPPETAGDASALPMLIGAFVHVEIEAGRLDDVYELPRAAVHPDDTVYLVDQESRLSLRTVEVAWRRPETVLVRGLEPGLRIITSRVPTPIEGTLLRSLPTPEITTGVAAP